MKRHKHINMGSVSSGTMRPEDLIPSFIDELESQHPCKREHCKLIRDIQERIAEQGDSYYEDGDADSDLSDLFGALGEYCAPYFYFGAHPGDGADYGYWLSEGFQYEFDGLIQDDSHNGRHDDMPRGYTGEYLHISDHGNMTLYHVVNGRKYEVWSVV